MKHMFAAAAVAALLGTAPAMAQTSPGCTVALPGGQSVACTFSIQVAVTPPTLAGLALSNTVFTGPAANAGMVIGALSVVTNPPGGTVPGLTLALTDPSGDLALSSPTLPANLVVGPNGAPAADYPITVTGTVAPPTGAAVSHARH
jgi:hypothetical protein